MKTRLLKISMMIVGLMFVFTAVSWADGGRERYRKHGPEKRIQTIHHNGGFHHRPGHHQIKRHHGPGHKFYHRPKWVPWHRQYHRNKWIHRHRQHHRYQRLHKLRQHWRHHRHYSDASYDDEAAYNEFSIAATFSEPGVEFSIGTKRTW